MSRALRPEAPAAPPVEPEHAIDEAGGTVAAMCEGGQIADVIAAVASIDPVMGGVDR